MLLLCGLKPDSLRESPPKDLFHLDGVRKPRYGSFLPENSLRWQLLFTAHARAHSVTHSTITRTSVLTSSLVKIKLHDLKLIPTKHNCLHQARKRSLLSVFSFFPFFFFFSSACLSPLARQGAGGGPTHCQPCLNSSVDPRGSIADLTCIP